MLQALLRGIPFIRIIDKHIAEQIQSEGIRLRIKRFPLLRVSFRQRINKLEILFTDRVRQLLSIGRPHNSDYFSQLRNVIRAAE